MWTPLSHTVTSTVPTQGHSPLHIWHLNLMQIFSLVTVCLLLVTQANPMIDQASQMGFSAMQQPIPSLWEFTQRMTWWVDRAYMHETARHCSWQSTHDDYSLTQCNTAHRYMNNSLYVGGGVLAHTILGVDFSETTGEILWVCMYNLGPSLHNERFAKLNIMLDG